MELGPESTRDLIEAAYFELRRLAVGYLRRERADHTLQPTALIHETYLQLVEQKRIRWQDRAHFVGTAAQLMRRVLREHARRRGASKRRHERVLLDDSLQIAGKPVIDAANLEKALDGLAERDPALARIVELRFFAGLNVEETAAAMGISTPTVKRHWRLAKAYLFRELNGEAGD